VQDIDPKLLRQFVAVARELHFGRAAQRMYIAQQALSRNIARLEKQLGVQLFRRSTRRVELTGEGSRLLPLAVELLALQARIHDELGEHLALRVDVMLDGSTAARVLEVARAMSPHVHLDARFHGGFDAAVRALLNHEVDVAFGRLNGVTVHIPADLPRRLVRFEPLALLLPDDHPWAGRDAIPTSSLEGVTVDTSAGNPAAPEWIDLGAELVHAHGGLVAPPHPPGMAAVAAAGPAETARHVRTTGWPILTKISGAPVPSTVIRPLVAPVPLYPWSMVRRPTADRPSSDALEHAVDRLIDTERWLDVPPDAWLATADQALPARAR
jgi:DNA-binding transcriptional LysR family regulator